MSNLKKNYRKIGKKQDNDVEANVAQLECSNNKCYALAFKYIQSCKNLMWHNIYLFILVKKRAFRTSNH